MKLKNTGLVSDGPQRLPCWSGEAWLLQMAGALCLVCGVKRWNKYFGKVVEESWLYDVWLVNEVLNSYIYICICIYIYIYEGLLNTLWMDSITETIEVWTYMYIYSFEITSCLAESSFVAAHTHAMRWPLAWGNIMLRQEDWIKSHKHSLWKESTWNDTSLLRKLKLGQTEILLILDLSYMFC